ncbi:MAG: response regulator transcription factor [Acidiferrobacterales bacterium]|nr:response regulator transcription factor [Acidiferrobacterales bacterium]
MKIVIADDHDLVRDALITLIERDDPNSEVFGASDFDGARELIDQQSDVDVLLLDVIMPGMANMTSVRTIRDKYPKIPVVLMSGHISQGDVERGFEMGARGFIPKTMNGKTLLSVLHLVVSGARYIPDLVLEESSDSKPAPAQASNLSARELDVLNELVKGLSNKVIAKNLGVEETTVKLHLRSLFKKLEVKNRTEAVIAAIEQGIISES